MEISIGILAGGKSTRFGQNKAFVKLGSKTFLEIITGELSGFEDIIVSVASKKEFKSVPYVLAEDFYKETGPVEGIRQVLREARNFYSFICATDMPFIKKEIVEYIKQFISSDYDCYVITTGDKIHPLCGIYSKNILDVLEESIKNKDYKLLNMLDKVRTKYIPLEYSCFSENLIRNINTREQYKKAAAPCIFCVSGIKNSGKTTLIKKLLEILKKDFSEIAVIKHDGHDFEIDHKGTDTYEFFLSGADQVSIFSKTKFAQVIRKQDMKIEEIIAKTDGAEIIIIEGLKYGPYPKIEIIREEVCNESVCDPDTLIAIATNNRKILDNNKKALQLSNIEDICKAVLEYFNR
jgi:molybdopterin-guanine dinucleotide biosynthesis protein